MLFGRKRAKVAIVIGQLTQGGAEKQIVLLAHQLQQRSEFEPVVFCTSSAIAPYGTALNRSGVQWHSPSTRIRGRLPRAIWLLSKIRTVGCGLVYGVLNTGNIYGGMAAWILRLPMIASIRSVNASLPHTIECLSALVCRHAQMVIANSQSCVVSLRLNLGVNHNRIRVIPNAVVIRPPNNGARSRLRREWNVPEQAFVVGTVANLKPEKRVGFFLRIAMNLHRACGEKVHSVWIGDGTDRDWVRQRLSAEPDMVSYVHFPGARDDIPDCLSAFNVFVLTSAYEGMPNALLEAMAAGLPCVATDVPGSRDVIAVEDRNEIGLLGDPDDPQSFAMVLQKLLLDSERMKRMGRNAAQHVRENYMVKPMVNAFSEVFQTVLDDHEL